MKTVHSSTLALAILAALLCLCSPSSSLPTFTPSREQDNNIITSSDDGAEAALMRAMRLDPTSSCESAIVKLLVTINESASAGLQFMFANGRGISDLGEYSSCQSIPGCNYWVVYIKYQQLPFNMTVSAVHKSVVLSALDTQRQLDI